MLIAYGCIALWAVVVVLVAKLLERRGIKSALWLSVLINLIAVIGGLWLFGHAMPYISKGWQQLQQPENLLILGGVAWLGLWVFFALVFKKKEVKQPIAAGWVASAVAIAVIGWAGMGASRLASILNPTREELEIRAKAAEEQYFLLSAGSLDHGRICKQAQDALTNYKKAGNKERAELFAYILISDKCL